MNQLTVAHRSSASSLVMPMMMACPAVVSPLA